MNRKFLSFAVVFLIGIVPVIDAEAYTLKVDKNRFVSIDAEDTPLKEILAELGKKLKVQVIIPSGYKKRVDIHFRLLPPEEAFRRLAGEGNILSSWDEQERLSFVSVASKGKFPPPSRRKLIGYKGSSVSYAVDNRNKTAKPDKGVFSSGAESDLLISEPASKRRALTERAFKEYPLYISSVVPPVNIAGIEGFLHAQIERGKSLSRFYRIAFESQLQRLQSKQSRLISRINAAKEKGLKQAFFDEYASLLSQENKLQAGRDDHLSMLSAKQKEYEEALSLSYKMSQAKE